MSNTSMEGREMIRKELQQLQQEWDTMISEVMDTKVMLESCLLQWSDYSHSYEKIQKWLRDMEKRLRETEPKADLGEKKSELQRLKVKHYLVLIHPSKMGHIMVWCSPSVCTSAWTL